jgi:hypothetical protein
VCVEDGVWCAMGSGMSDVGLQATRQIGTHKRAPWRIHSRAVASDVSAQNRRRGTSADPQGLVQSNPHRIALNEPPWVEVEACFCLQVLGGGLGGWIIR